MFRPTAFLWFALSGRPKAWQIKLAKIFCSRQPNYFRHLKSMSVSQTAETPALRGSGITLESVIGKTDVSTRRTKIVCTMGPASWSEEGLATLLDAGMNLARFNFSHGDHAGHGAVLERLRKVAKSKSRNIGRFQRLFGSHFVLQLLLQLSYWIQRDQRSVQGFSPTINPK